MKRATETRVIPRSWAVLAVTLAVLAGCEEALSTKEALPDAPTDDSQTGDNTIELFPGYAEKSRETVEAPDAFNVSEAALWDGRPSLGGIWVAHPDVTQPERVVIKNPNNNKSVNGALFRRERNLPGPALQLSSAAAAELGILAGAPTKVQVTALRRKPAKKEEPKPEENPTTETAETKPDSDEGKPADDAVETAAADAEKPAKRKWWQKKETVAAAGAAGAVAAATSDNAVETTTEVAEDVVEPAADAAVEVESTDTEKPAKRKWWQKKETVAATGAAGAAAAATDDSAAETTPEAVDDVVEAAAQTTPPPSLSDPEVTAPEEKPAKRKWWQKKDPNEITETPLDPVAGAAAAIEAADPTPVSAPAASSLTKPFVQVGTFNVEANANSAAQKIKRNGMSASVRELKTDDKTVWRVLVGPATTRSERNALQSDVKDLGFSDAFTVKN